MGHHHWGLAAGLAAAIAFAPAARAQSAGPGFTGTQSRSGTSARAPIPQHGSPQHGATGQSTGGETVIGRAGGTQHGTGPQGAGQYGAGERRAQEQGAAGQQRAGQGSGQQLGQELGDGVQQLHAANQAEIQLSQLAARQAQSEDVKQYAERMVDEHQRNDRQLQGWAEQRGVQLQGEAFQQEQRRAEQSLRQLQGQTGAEFDRAFMDRMVQDHELNSRRVEQLAQQARGEHPQLAAMLQRTHAALQGHLRHAEQVEQRIARGGQQGEPQRQGRRGGITGSQRGSTGAGPEGMGGSGSGSGGAGGTGYGTGGTGGGYGAGDQGPQRR